MKNLATFRTIISTMLVLGSLSLAVSASATPPTHFHFYYVGNLNARHDFERLQGGLWEEIYQDGGMGKFHTFDSDYYLDGNKGTLIKADGGEFYLFIPDRDATGTNPHWIRQSTDGHNFTWFNEMEGIE